MLKYDYERWSREATLVMYDALTHEDLASLRQLLMDAMRDTDFLKIDLSQVGHISPVCGEMLFSFSDEEKGVSKRLLIFRRKAGDAAGLKSRLDDVEE